MTIWSASAAFDAEINARPQDFPLVGATGMVFFHLYDIANRKLHGLSLLLLYDMQGALREGDFDAFFVQPVFDAAAQLCFYGNVCFHMAFCHDFYGNGGIIQPVTPTMMGVSKISGMSFVCSISSRRTSSTWSMLAS